CAGAEHCLPASHHLSQGRIFVGESDLECDGQPGSRCRVYLRMGEGEKRGPCQCSPYSIHRKIYVCEATSKRRRISPPLGDSLMVFARRRSKTALCSRWPEPPHQS